MRVGVFDSGVGGISVLAELKKRFSNQDFVYLGDTANVPYGSKSPAQIEKLSVGCVRILKESGIDAIVVACNTASSWALPAIEREAGGIPVLGVVEPGVEAVVRASATRPGSSDVLILATRATVQSRAYSSRLRRISPGLRVFEKECPLLVPMIEEGWVDHPILHQTIAEYVAPFSESPQTGIALLACTHYPWVQAAFERALPRWKLIHSAEAVADALEPRLGKSGSGRGEVRWIFTDPQAVPQFARSWMEGVNHESGKKDERADGLREDRSEL